MRGDETGARRIFYRITAGPIPYREDFLSARDLGVVKAPPDGLEREWAESISVYDNLDYAVRRAETAARDIGRFVVPLSVPLDGTVELAQTGKNRRHYSIYGRPDDLIQLVDGASIPVKRG